MLKNLNIIILECIFLFVTPNIVSAQSSNDSQSNIHLARVISPKAIIYADENMNAPIGHIVNDKLIHVGNPRKRNPDLLPIIVYGRIAYIESKNIHFEDEGADESKMTKGTPREHNIDIVLEQPPENLSENNSAYFYINQFSGGQATKDLFSNIDESQKSNYFGIGTTFIHRQTPGKVFWGSSFEYNAISNSNINLSMFLIRPTLGFTPLRTSLFLIDLYFSVDFSLGAQLKIKNNSDTEPSLFIWGPSFGSKIVFFPNKNYHIFGAIAYRRYFVKGIETVYDSNETSISGIDKIAGVDLALGLAIEF